MKNIFKLLGIAILACGMMTACGGDDPENSGGNNGGNNGGGNQTATTKVTFGTTEWTATAGLMYTGNLNQYGVIQARLYQNDGQLPYVDFITTTTNGDYTAQAEILTADEGYTYSNGTNSMEIYDVQYGAQSQVSAGNNYYGDWGLLNATLKVTAFDANALTYSCKLTANMYDFYSWYNALVDNVEDADTQNLTVEINNFTFTNWQ